ncbi:IclR family transcriptional regulator [soil metagenome]
MQLLDSVLHHGVEGASLRTLAIAVDLSKPTAHRLLTGLRHAGLIDYDPIARLFHPAFKLVRMGESAGRRFDVIKLAGPALKRLAQETGDTVYLTIRSGDVMVCVARELGPFPIRTLTLDVGDVRPLGLGSNGLTLLAALPDSEVDRLLKVHRVALRAYPKLDAFTIRELIERARADGLAVNEGLMLAEMSAIAMGVRGPAGTVDASISIAAITSRMLRPRRDTVARLLRDEVVALERLMRPGVDARKAA